MGRRYPHDEETMRRFGLAMLTEGEQAAMAYSDEDLAIGLQAVARHPRTQARRLASNEDLIREAARRLSGLEFPVHVQARVNKERQRREELARAQRGES